MKRRRKSSGRSKKRRLPGLKPRHYLAAVALGILGLVAVLPFGAVTVWAVDAVLLGTLAVGLAMAASVLSVSDNGGAPVPGRASRWWIPALGLLLWAVFQTLPLPATVVLRMQSGWALLLDGADPRRLSLAVDRAETLYAVAFWGALAGLAVVVSVFFRGRQGARLLAHVIMVLGTFQAVAALVIPGLSSSWWSSFRVLQRLQGTFSGPNTLGGFLVITIPVSLGLLLSSQNRLLDVVGVHWKRMLALPTGHQRYLIEWVWVFLCLLSQIVVLIGSGSRGAVIGCLVAVSVLLVTYLASMRESRVAALRVYGLLLVAVLFMATGGGLYLLMQRFQFDDVWDHGFHGRLLIWRAAMRLIRSFPLGVGAGAFPHILPIFQSSSFAGYRLDHAHNDYLQWTGEFGVPGLVLAATMLYFLLARIVATARITGARHAVWIWRGAGLAVLAALIHAAVDFNLMARPAVRWIFFMACGLLATVPRAAWGDTEKTDRAPRSPSGRVFVLVALLVAAIGIGVLSYRRMQAVWWMEGARVALGLPVDRYFWAPPPWTPPDRATDVLAWGVESYPRIGRFRYALAMGYMARYEQERQAAVEAAWMSANVFLPADRRRIEDAIDMAMRWDWSQIVDKALQQALWSAELAPWDSDTRVLAANLHAQAAVWSAEQVAATHRREAVKMLESALMRAPFDMRILSEACRALALLYKAARLAGDDQTAEYAIGELTVLGRRAVEVAPRTTRDVLDAWESAGLTDSQLADAASVPIPVLLEMYRYYANSQEAAQASNILERLAVLYAGDPDAPDDRQTLFLARERYRWMLWEGATAEYRAGLAQRLKLWGLRQQQALAEASSYDMSDVALRLRLREIDYRIGLGVENLLRLSRLEWERAEFGVAMDLLARALALGGGRPGSDPEVLELIGTWRAGIDERREHYALSWLDARLRQNGGDVRAAADRFGGLRHKAFFPVRFRHRIYLEEYSAWRDAGDPVAAAAALAKALEYGNNDPDCYLAMISEGRGDEPFRGSDGRLMSASERLLAINPALETAMRFLGGRVELTGFTLEPHDAMFQASTLLRLHWRFFDRVPADLGVSVRIIDRDGYVFFRRVIAFGESMPREFAVGEPRAGSLLNMDVLLPPRARVAGRLEVRLVSGGKRISSDEGLAGFETGDWIRFIQEPPAD